MAMSKEERNRRARERYALKKANVGGGRYVRGGRAFMKAGGITSIPVPVNVAVAVQARKKRGDAGYVRGGYKLMKSGGIFGAPIAVSTRKQRADAGYVKGGYKFMKSGGIFGAPVVVKVKQTRTKMSAEEKRAKARARYAQKRLAQGKPYTPKK